MNVDNGTRKRWDEDSYSRIGRARCDWEGTVLTVEFEDGDQVELAPMPLLPRGTNPDDVDWWRVGSNEAEVLFPIGETWFEVPWDVIRLRTDTEFDAHWARMAQEIAQSRGIRLRGLREARGLSVAEVAARAGLLPETVERIESGDDSDGAEVPPLLNALDCTERDLDDHAADQPIRKAS
jgi:DNA-binding XRE family transcriptional regulator